MKLIKKLLLVLTFVIGGMILVGCNKDLPPEPKPQVDIKLEDVQRALNKAFKDYEDAEHGKVQVVMKKGEETSTLDLVFNYEEGKYSVESLASVLKDSNGELSCYIEDGQAYINRYGQSKTKVKVTETESETIVNNYGFSAYTHMVKLMFGTSFFKSASIASYTDGVAKVELNIGQYDLASDDYDDDELQSIFDSLKEKSSVKAEIKYVDGVVSNVKIELVGDVTSSIEVKFLGTQSSDIAIEFPSFDDYE